ncbi:hypothetical protein WJX81_008653 [Elliptochloris bilobata]|uniref:Enoyl-CoA hydratase n=1 Tax=Elliptochloris bilobata TaxID=381761 RepID=A0AAW1R1W9_9CHLO
MAHDEYETIKVSTEDAIGTITLSRPKALNALNDKVMEEVVAAAEVMDADPAVRAIIITGDGPKAFAAGADIKEMSTLTYSEAFHKQLGARLGRLADVRKPTIAAVAGYALGGGCELAMLADILIAADTAVFGQPEVTLGVIPGLGGTQRLVRAVGKAKAMEVVLGGARLTAEQAERAGLAARVVPAAELMAEARALAGRIAAASAPAVAKAKDCVLRALETPLAEGLRYEQREFWSCFALQDQKEGMAAFIEKRKPVIQDK